MAAAAQALHRHVVCEACDDDLAAARLFGAVHREKITVEDSGVAHRHAAHAQQIVRPRRKEIRIHLVMALHVLFGEDRRACRNTPDDRQLEQPRAAARAARIAHAKAARGPG